MSGGTVNISRAIWDDPTFRDGEMTQREAWMWMIAEASWKGRVRRVGAAEITLRRGQLAASSRFLAKAWMWSEPRVRRYFDMLENRRMIERVTDAGVTVITICNYEKYQGDGSVCDAPTDAPPTHHRRTTDANEKKGERRGKEREEEHSADAECGRNPIRPPKRSAEVDPDEPPPKRRRSVPIPEAWTPSDRNIADADQRGFSQQEIDHEADRFRDYHLAKGSTFKDWDAAWRTWLGNAARFSGGRPAAFGAAGGARSRGDAETRAIHDAVRLRTAFRGNR